MGGYEDEIEGVKMKWRESEKMKGFREGGRRESMNI